MSLSITDLPPEVIADNLLPFLPTADLLRLTLTSKLFASLCSDETVWKRRLREDFNFDGAGTARRSGWKFIYRGLYRPRVYVWGQSSDGRLGLRRYPKSSRRGSVPFPVQLEIPGTSIVRLIAGGTSFHALDTRGNVYVWGTLGGEWNTGAYGGRFGFVERGKRVSKPHKLKLPNPVRSISCGRFHSCALDSKNKIWTFVSWGLPFQLSSGLLSQSDSEPLQIECGWEFASVLMKTGDVLVWWPRKGSLHEAIRNKEKKMSNEDIPVVQDAVIPCQTWEASIDPVLLPPLPELPDISEYGVDFKENPPRLVQIGGMDSHIVGLTNHGHVVLFRGLDHENAIGTRGWEYLPEFSEVSKVRGLDAFSEGKIPAPEKMGVTHISAHFHHFFAFSTGSSSIVLQGGTETTPDSKPDVIPELQHKDIISVELGDWHKVALSANGKLYSWGQYSNGALGLGDPRDLPIGVPGGYASEGDKSNGGTNPRPVETPTEVRFDHGRKTSKDRFCFSATAAGWHTGALVLDLEPDENEDDDRLDTKFEGRGSDTDSDDGDDDYTPSHPPPHRVPHLYRFGFPARGMMPQSGRGGHPNA